MKHKLVCLCRYSSVCNNNKIGIFFVFPKKLEKLEHFSSWLKVTNIQYPGGERGLHNNSNFMSMGDPHTQPQPQDFYIIKTGSSFLDHICVAPLRGVPLPLSPVVQRGSVSRDFWPF